MGYALQKSSAKGLLSAQSRPATVQGDLVLTLGRLPGAHASNANMRFQSFFILTTIQPFLFASS